MDHTIDRTHINRFARGRLAFIIALVGVIVVAGFFAAVNVRSVVTKVTATYTTVTGEVIDEGTEKQLEGSRRTRHWVEYRTVDIRYTLDGQDSTGEVRSDDLEVGAETTIWVRASTGDVRLTPPESAGFWDWAWAVVTIAITALIAWLLVISMRDLVRLRRFHPGDREPDFVFVIQHVDGAPPIGGTKGTVHLDGVAEHVRDGKSVKVASRLSTRGVAFPTIERLPSIVRGYQIVRGAARGTVVLHSQELQEWWAAELTLPEDRLTTASSAPPAQG